MRPELLILAAELARREEPFAMATVVRREPASSAQSGDTALITEAGAFHGWLGGSCTQPTVVREALRALSDGKPRFISLSPDPDTDHRPGIVVFPMTCHSGGSVDIYIEPVSPPARFLIFGLSPVARALSRLAKAMGYAVDVSDPEADRAAFPEADRVWTALPKGEAPARGALAVVATMGEHDEDAVLEALSTEPAYLGVVASGKRFAQIRQLLLDRGAAAEALERVKSPAGLDIGAQTPEEIALSILAEIVQRRRSALPKGESAEAARPSPATERDPVCGMTVELATARHRAELDGRSYFFCCGGCRERFLAAPERFAVVAGSEAAG